MKHISLKGLAILFSFVFALFYSSLTAQPPSYYHKYCYNDSAITIRNVAIEVAVLNNDSLVPRPDAYNHIQNPNPCDYPFPYGKLKSQYGGILTFLGNGKVKYDPPSNFSGRDRFYYGMCNGSNPYQTDTAVVTVTVVNQGWHRHKYAYNDFDTTEVNVPIDIPVLDNDSLHPHDSAINYLAKPTVCDFPFRYGALKTKEGGTLTLLPNGKISYTPRNSFCGYDEFIYAICDSGSNNQIDSAVVKVAVLATVSINGSGKLPLSCILYPNPAKDKVIFHIKGAALLKSPELILFDISGREIKRLNITSESTEISLKTLQPGIYFYTLKDANGVMGSGKLVVEF